MRLEYRRALITGAGQGIGRACAEVFAERGADLVLLDRNPETLEIAVKAAMDRGSKVTALTLDLTDLESLEGKLDQACRDLPIDILVNNAGFDRPGTSARLEMSGFSEVLGIHLSVPLFLIKLFLPTMKARKWGRIINVSSIYGLIGAKAEVAYSTAKAGLIGLTKSIAREAGPRGVTVNAVAAGLTRTPTIEKMMAEKYKQDIIIETPLGRMAEPEEIARVIAFLASEDASYITAAVIPVSGGWGI
ncbi:MAG: SDR family oxidoreductase [Deltaproteobacteria bacterium]|nr:SDR family oxidoreductase [Deltaproteobacteria bacterium]